MREITDAEFPQAVKEGKVVVDFYSTFCRPCKTLAPILESLDGKIGGVTFVKINVDDEMLMAALNAVTQLPTLILFEDRHEVKRHSGVMSAPDLKKWIEV